MHGPFQDHFRREARCMDRFKTISDEKFDEAVSKVLNARFKRFPPPSASRRARRSIVGDEPVIFAADGGHAMQAAAFGAEGSDSDELTPAPAWHGKRAMLCSALLLTLGPDIGPTSVKPRRRPDVGKCRRRPNVDPMSGPDIGLTSGPDVGIRRRPDIGKPTSGPDVGSTSGFTDVGPTSACSRIQMSVFSVGGAIQSTV